MQKNGQEISRFTQWDAAAMLDFPTGGEACVRESRDLSEALGNMAVGPSLENRKLRPLIDPSGNAYGLSAREWTGVLDQRAAALQGISYAGEPPAAPRRPEPGFSGFPTLP